MTPTEHAELIERISGHLTRLDKEAAIPGVGDQLLRHEHSTELLRSAIAALRTSRRDGWLDAADAVTNSDHDPTGLMADHLRSNAPQEATDEA